MNVTKQKNGSKLESQLLSSFHNDTHTDPHSHPEWQLYGVGQHVVIFSGMTGSKPSTSMCPPHRSTTHRQSCSSSEVRRLRLRLRQLRLRLRVLHQAHQARRMTPSSRTTLLGGTTTTGTTPRRNAALTEEAPHSGEALCSRSLADAFPVSEGICGASLECP